MCTHYRFDYFIKFFEIINCWAFQQVSKFKQFNVDELKKRAVIIGQHCYGCTADAGSSCGGAVA